MTALIKVKATIKDHWANWNRDFYPAPKFDRASYQKRINEITGLAQGEPILKLEWGGDESRPKASEWNADGSPVKIDIVPKHAIPRQNPILGVLELIPIRRWIITQYLTPQAMRSEDNSDNSFTNEHGVTCQEVEKPKGDYTPLIYIGNHENCAKDCCEKKICLGDYKQPGVAELDWILGSTYKLQSEMITNPFRSQVTPDELKKINNEILKEQTAKKEKEDAEFDQNSLDWFKTHGHRITGNNLNRGKYI